LEFLSVLAARRPEGCKSDEKGRDSSILAFSN